MSSILLISITAVTVSISVGLILFIIVPDFFMKHFGNKYDLMTLIKNDYFQTMYIMVSFIITILVTSGAIHLVYNLTY